MGTLVFPVDARFKSVYLKVKLSMSVHRAPHKTDFQESTQQSLMDHQPPRFLFVEKPQEIKAQGITLL